MAVILSDYHEIFDERGAQYHQAMEKYPDARNLEFILPLNLCGVQSGHVLVDIPSGGGYLQRYLPEDVKLYCLESSRVFADFCQQRRGCHGLLFSDNRIPLMDQMADRLISIAGLHHVEDKPILFSEMCRILKTGGLACLVDVQENSRVARFLDDVVDRYSVTGHQGLWFDSTTSDQLQTAGFRSIKCERLSYHWEFDSIASMIKYVKLLFGLVYANDEEVLAGIEKYLQYSVGPNTVQLNWQLLCYLASR